MNFSMRLFSRYTHIFYIEENNNINMIISYYNTNKIPFNIKTVSSLIDYCFQIPFQKLVVEIKVNKARCFNFI